jgi:competence protein CoiA
MKFKFADVDGERREAEPGLSGKCLFCGDAMIAKCGPIRVWHWAHRGTRTCDPWWESETPWHRAWKDHFPKAWQEIIHQSQNSEKHIADVKTESGLVIEFQHSHLRPVERESRETFYRKMVWVVDAASRKRDRAQFFASVDAATVINHEPALIVLVRWKEGALLRDWGASSVPVYFDFGDTPFLWRLNPCIPNGVTYLSRVPKTVFLDAHLKGIPFEEMASAAVERAAARYLMRQAPRPQPLKDFERYLAQRERKRRRDR